jgi:ABC-type glycerol-3-phosphate transport system permease component
MKIRVFRLLSYLVVLGAVLVYGIPIIWIIVSSFKPVSNALIGYGIGQVLFLFTPTLSAYQRVLSTPFVADLTHSLLVAIGTVLACLVLGLPAAYQLARVRNSFTRNIAAWIISTRMAPAFALSLSFFVLMTQIIRVYDTVFALIIAYLTFNLSLAIWILMGYMQDIPVDIEKAAMMDGASRFQVFRRIIIPLSRPAVVTVSIIVFLFSWNEFLFAFLLTSTQARTVPVFIANYVGIVVIDWPAMTAISTMFMVPALVLLIIAQKYIVKGLTLGALK